MCILVGTTLDAGVTSIVSEKVIVSTPVTLLSSDESKVGGVLSWTCANACPGNLLAILARDGAHDPGAGRRRACAAVLQECHGDCRQDEQRGCQHECGQGLLCVGGAGGRRQAIRSQNAENMASQLRLGSQYFDSGLSSSRMRGANPAKNSVSFAPLQGTPQGAKLALFLAGLRPAYGTF